MLTTKPGSSQSKEPDPALTAIDPTQVIFMSDEPTKKSDDNDEVQPYELAKKVQGSIDGNADHGATNPPAPVQDSLNLQDDKQLEPTQDHDDTHLDTSTKALTDEYKKGLKDLTTMKDQPLADVTIQAKVSAAQTPDLLDAPAETQQIMEDAVETNQEIEIERIVTPQEKQQAKIDAIEQFNQLMQTTIPQSKKQPELTALALAKKVSAQPMPKVASNKHRPIEVAAINQSKLELNKDVTENSTPKKKKLSLQDLNLDRGFSDFVRKGNAQFSANGNADQDNAMGLKRKSYMNQIAKMYENACNAYPTKLPIKNQDFPTGISTILVIIERSGKVSEYKLLTGVNNPICEKYHMEIVKFMGDFPPIAKYMEAPLMCKFDLYWKHNGSFMSYTPQKLQL
jgi:hypothetical protein